MIRKNKVIEKAALMKEALQNNNATGVDFAGMNYAQFVSGVAPSFDQREESGRWSAAGNRKRG